MEPDNLWGDLTGITGFKTAAALLKEQADILSQITASSVTATVIQSVEDSTITVDLYLKGRRLEKYSNNLLTIEHGVEGYPFKIRDHLLGKDYEANNAEEFKQVLNTIFSSKETRNLIGSLMSYSGKMIIEKQEDSE